MMLTIGIVNNMSMAAIQSTDRQFTEILTEAADGMPIKFRWFRLAGARPDHYESLDALWSSQLDGMIVTGAEPRSSNLRDEPFWQPLTKTVDWAVANTRSTIWSCLATHAAVMHLDGIERVRQPEKTFGLYSSWLIAEHPLLTGFRPVWNVPHSRWHDLPREALEAFDYQVLAVSQEAGVDLFVKQMSRSLFFFIQSHYEYDLGALIREYRRNVARYQVGHAAHPPALPKNYFDDATLAALSAAENPSQQTEILDRATTRSDWRPLAVQLYRNWLRTLTKVEVRV